MEPSYPCVAPARQAGIVVIGNEVLSGKVADTNAAFLLRELYALGVQVRRVTVIPDCLKDIALEIRRASDEFSFVITSGGIGPTHDDITFEGVAMAFNVPLEENLEMRSQLEKHFKDRITQATLKMARIPKGASLIYREHFRFPLVVMKNVYVFPGVPELLQSRFISIREVFKSEPFFLVRIFTRQDESALAALLEQTLEAFPTIEIGSYPRFDATEYRVLLTLESKQAEELCKARDYLLTLLEESAVVRVESPQGLTEPLVPTHGA